ncbi:DUF3429 domain-containing protein [Sphingomonas jatrophae]|uniref:DUF3429 domain-containing protein n=1 Tax=Sphingomonas jatrophae TaxID=1166337 RepID=A0A1I6LDL2_9SPHN|nr:DUF3429 domain-containing protein [Sphingomonas jatrophae]SFS01612.1 Protein of unknown function [Sphingomonas jatrophae]
MTGPAPTAAARDPRIPPLSVALGFGPAAILPLLALAAFLLPPRTAWIAVALAQLWGGSILLFLAGVRRGLSFFTEGGPRPVQVATSVWLFVLGLAGLALPAPFAFLAQILGYGTVGLTDPRAAKRGEVPAHFARLRPPQMAIAVLGLVALTVRVSLG